MYHFKPRLNNFRLITGLRSRDNGQGGGIQAGFATYSDTEDGDQTYQVTYAEFGGRSDHIVDAIDSLCGDEVAQRRVSAPVGDDAMYIGTPEQNARAVKEQAKKAKASAKSDDDADVVVASSDTPTLQAVV